MKLPTMITGLACLLFAACGGDDDGTDDNTAGADASASSADAAPEVDLVDRAGCHMTPFQVPPDGTPTVVCLQFQSGACLVGNEVGLSCFDGERVAFEWEAGNWYNVKTFGWTPKKTSHGELTTETNADGGILGIPPSTYVEAEFDHTDSGDDWLVGFRMEDDYVYFDYVIQRLGTVR